MTAQPPSTAAQPSVLATTQEKSDRIYGGRPFEPTNISLSLLHPVFGEFRDSTKTIEPSAKDNNAVLELTEMMLKFYKKEKERETEFHKFFVSYFGVQLHTGSINGTSSGSDGHGFPIPNSPHSLIHVITEIKNELAGNNTDPYFQVAFLYRDYLKTFPSGTFSHTSFPVMVVLVFGKYQNAQSASSKTDLIRTTHRVLPADCGHAG